MRFVVLLFVSSIVACKSSRLPDASALRDGDRGAADTCPADLMAGIGAFDATKVEVALADARAAQALLLENLAETKAFVAKQMGIAKKMHDDFQPAREKFQKADVRFRANTAYNIFALGLDVVTLGGGSLVFKGQQVSAKCGKMLLLAAGGRVIAKKAGELTVLGGVDYYLTGTFDNASDFSLEGFIPIAGSILGELDNRAAFAKVEAEYRIELKAFERMLAVVYAKMLEAHRKIEMAEHALLELEPQRITLEALAASLAGGELANPSSEDDCGEPHESLPNVTTNNAHLPCAAKVSERPFPSAEESPVMAPCRAGAFVSLFYALGQKNQKTPACRVFEDCSAEHEKLITAGVFQGAARLRTSGWEKERVLLERCEPLVVVIEGAKIGEMPSGKPRHRLKLAIRYGWAPWVEHSGRIGACQLNRRDRADVGFYFKRGQADTSETGYFGSCDGADTTLLKSDSVVWRLR